MPELAKIYEPKKVEDRIYKFWEKSGFFNPDKLPKRHKKPYCIVIPPPNITGELHMGHALNAVVQDILIRWRRLQGYKTLWLPGTDHAGIATQNVVEKQLKKEGKTRFDLGREKFIGRVWQWVEKYKFIILNQFKKMGASCDWSRTRFTLDNGYVKAVETAFLHYYKKGWIYRGERTVNWCPRCQTSLSDLELEYREEGGYLWFIRYLLRDPSSSTRPGLVVATTRPETILGDTAVAVNPKDERYKDFIGKKVILPLVNREIPIIADISVDPNFGTGVVKITPAHDIHDFELGEKHNLERKQVIGQDGRMTKLAGKYAGLTVKEARMKIVEDMKKIGILEKVEPYTHNVAHCYRCNATIEPLLSKQWFLKMGELVKSAVLPVKKGEIKFHPKRFEKPFFDWLKNIKDWCISRQIWWGHKIPIEGETDVLDTWFSSALWPFATLGWPASAKATAGKPKKKSDLAKFYPTDVLSTDRGIINLWVARMIFSSMEFVKKIPFRDVYVHATVLTKEGKRMSKSLGTGVDPILLIDKYGADATRFGIAYQIMGGQDIRFVEDNIMMGKKFCNKIWNAARFVLLQFSIFNFQWFGYAHHPEFAEGFSKNFQFSISKLTTADKKILKSLNKTIKSVNNDLENFQFGQTTHTLYDFFWHDFCDKYIEKSKKQNDKKTKKILLFVLLNSLKLLHPFMPFITEEIYQNLPIKNKKKCLMIENWPV